MLSVITQRVLHYSENTRYQRNTLTPFATHISERIYDNKIRIKCEGGCLAEFLKENLKKISKERERKLCLKIAELCGDGKIRSLHPVTNPYNRESFTAEIEVGTLKD
jgi:hypothetical protein